MATLTTDISITVGTDFKSIDIVDTTGYAGATDIEFTIDIYKPKTDTAYATLDKTSVYEAAVLAATSDEVSYSITPEDFGYEEDTVFLDGEYTLIFSISRVVSAVTQTATITDYELLFGNVYGCLQSLVKTLSPDILSEDCGCSKKSKSNTENYFTMYMLLQSAIFSHNCSNFNDAQSKIDSLLTYCSTNCTDC